MTTALCGLPHYEHPQTVCTQPAHHYRPERDSHAGPLIIDGRVCGGVAWDEPKDTPMPIQPGQVYVSCHPLDEGRRIKIVGEPGTVPGVWGFGKVDVVTLTPDGRELRRRAIETSQLHDHPTRRDGTPRRNGWCGGR